MSLNQRHFACFRSFAGADRMIGQGLVFKRKCPNPGLIPWTFLFSAKRAARKEMDKDDAGKIPFWRDLCCDLHGYRNHDFMIHPMHGSSMCGQSDKKKPGLLLSHKKNDLNSELTPM